MEHVNMKPVTIIEDWTCKCGERNIMHMNIPLGYIKSYRSVDMLCQGCEKPRVHEFSFTDEQIESFTEALKKQDKIEVDLRDKS